MVLHHQVAAGDTLSSIARKYSTTVAAIARANSWIADINLVQPGWVFHIPDPTPTPEPEPEPEPPVVEWDDRQPSGAVFGPPGSHERLIRPAFTWIGAFRGNGINLPHKWDGNNSSAQYLLGSFIRNNIRDAVTKYHEFCGPQFMWPVDDEANGGFGPRLLSNIRMSRHVHGNYNPNAKNFWKPANLNTPEKRIDSVFEKARTARGDYDDAYHAYWQGIDDACTEAVGGYTDWWRRVDTCYGHEPAPWYGDSYAGWDLSLIGHPTLAERDRLDDLFGEPVAAILHQIGIDGDLGPLYKHNFDRMAQIAYQYSTDASLCFLRAHPGAVPFGEEDTGDLSRDWNPAAVPDPSSMAVLGLDLYSSPGAIPKNFQGGDPREPANWDLSDTLSHLELLKADSQRLGKPMCLREMGLRIPKTSPQGQGNAASDAAAAMFLRVVYDWIRRNEVTYWCQWKQGPGKEAQQNYTSTPDPNIHPLTWEVLVENFSWSN